MRNLLNRRRNECEQLQDLLESSAAGVPGGGIEELAASFAGGWARALRGLQKLPRSLQDLRATREMFVGCRRTRGGWRAMVREAGTVCDRSARTRACFPLSAWSLVPRFASRLAWTTAIRASSWQHLAVSKVHAKYDPAAGGGVFAGISV